MGALKGNGLLKGMVWGTSVKYQNLFTPAGYAFAIWGVIFPGLVIVVVSQLVMSFDESENSESILQIGPWLGLANVGNAAWVWLHEQLIR